MPTHGLRKAGGFVDLATTPDLAGIAASHAMAPEATTWPRTPMSMTNKEYKRDALTALGLISPPTEAQCTVCHNDKSPFFQPFDFAKRKVEGTHEHKR